MITCNAVIKTLGVLVFVSVTALPASGEVPSACTNWPAKPPWEWTIEERLAHRFQRDCLVARRREAGDTSRPDGSCLAKGNVADFVFGDRLGEVLPALVERV